MTTATTITPQTGLNPIRSHTTVRVGSALVVILIAGLGLWGAIATTQSARAYQETKRLQGAVEQARYSLVLERSALRAGATVRGREAYAAAASAFEFDLRRIVANGTEDDATRARFVRDRHALLIADLGLRPDRLTGPTPSAGQVLEFDQRASALDAPLSTLLSDVRGRASYAWPDGPAEQFALAALGLLIVVGLSSCAIFLLRLAGYRRRLERGRRDELARLERAARTDSLTGLGNHRAFHEDLERELARRDRTGSRFSVVMLDLDGLKEINDTLGHGAGDDRLRAVAECFSATLQKGGAYRTGGDEFMVLLPDEEARGAMSFAERFQTEIARHRMAPLVSCGIAEASAFAGAEALGHQADLALYEAKRSGRKIVVYSAGVNNEPAVPADEIVARRHRRLVATALAQAVDAKDSGTRSHCETVSGLCVLIGQSLGLSDERVEQLRLAGLLHDVGKIGIADAVLRKPGRLDADERYAMSCHVRLGHSIVAAAGFVEEAEWILRHHEFLDGNGYPEGLRGPAIPLESRIIQVADAFEAMTANRPYRAALRLDEAFAELERGTGTQFDGTCVAALRSALGSDAAAAAHWFAPAEPEHFPLQAAA